MKYKKIITVFLLLILTVSIIYFLSLKMFDTRNDEFTNFVPSNIKHFLRKVIYVPVLLAEKNELENLYNIVLSRNKDLGIYNRGLKFMTPHLRSLKEEDNWLPEFRQYNIDRQRVPCPKSADVILFAGQSNSANHVLSKKYEKKQHVNYFFGSCYVLESPVLGATGNHSSVVPSIASKLTSKLPYIFLTTGWAGSSIRDWGGENSYLSRYTNIELKDLERHGNNLIAVIWIQGENDNKDIVDYYNPNFTAMKSQILKGLKNKDDVKFIVTQSSICAIDQDRNMKLNAKQLQLGNDKNTYVTEVTDNLDQKYRYDGCHYNELGTEKIAEEISSLLNNIL